jgi:hypothetical protein
VHQTDKDVVVAAALCYLARDAALELSRLFIGQLHSGLFLTQ